MRRISTLAVLVHEFRPPAARHPRERSAERTKEKTVTFRQCGRAAVVVALLGLAAMTTGREAPAIESGRSVAPLGAHLGPAPHEVTGFKNLDPNFRRASNWTRTRIAILGMFSLIGSPRHFAPLAADDVDTSVLWGNRRSATAPWVG